MNNFYVYLHYRKDTLQPFYVGKGSGRRIDSKKSRNKYWHNIVNKHGLFAQIMESNLTEEQAFEREMFYISVLGKENLCNMTDGGDGTSGYKHSDYWKLNHSNIMKGNNNPNKKNPMRHTSISKEKISKAMKLENNPRAKKVVNIETNEIYGCAKAVANKYNFNYPTFTSYLKGTYKHKLSETCMWRFFKFY